LVFLGLWIEGVRPQRLPSCLQGRPLHKSIDSACVLEKKGTKNMYIFIKVGEIKGRRIKLLKQIFALYSLPIIFFLKNFLAPYARLIVFILHLKMQACNVLYQPHHRHHASCNALLCTDEWRHLAIQTTSKFYWSGNFPILNKS